MAEPRLTDAAARRKAATSAALVGSTRARADLGTHAELMGRNAKYADLVGHWTSDT